MNSIYYKQLDLLFYDIYGLNVSTHAVAIIIYTCNYFIKLAAVFFCFVSSFTKHWNSCFLNFQPQTFLLKTSFKKVKNISAFSCFLSPRFGGGLIWTLEHRIIGRSFYHWASVACHSWNNGQIFNSCRISSTHVLVPTRLTVAQKFFLFFCFWNLLFELR